MKFTLHENDKVKFVCSEDLSYKYSFNKQSGDFQRWGYTLDDDPDFSPIGPEVCDIEVSTICHQKCKGCYKSNVARGENMSLETFKTIFHKLPRTVCQIAFGVGDIDANPDLWNIMRYCRENSYNFVVPNITINGYRMTDEYFSNLATLCGAVAVSSYNREVCFATVQRLSSLGLKQVNIHQILHEDSYQECMELIDLHAEGKIPGLRALVFLLLKPKGRGKCLTQLRDLTKYKALIDKALDKNVAIGFDSCSAGTFLSCISGRPNVKNLTELAEPCESNLFSAYINTAGYHFHCSFTEGELGWEGINLLEIEDYIKDVWYHPEVVRFRNKLLENKRQCFVHNLGMK